MIEFLKEFFLNAGVFKGTVRALLVFIGVGMAAVPDAVLEHAPIWFRVAGLFVAGVGVWLRSTSQKREPRKTRRALEPGERWPPSPEPIPDPPDPDNEDAHA